jgi:hypothetical protein
MTHKTRVERHIIVDVLAGACGASAVTAVLQRSWLAFSLALILGGVLYLIERETIEEEDEILEEKMRVPDLIVETLQKIAGRVRAEKVLPEDEIVYQLGLNDGAADLAQYVLDEMKEEISNA